VEVEGDEEDEEKETAAVEAAVKERDGTGRDGMGERWRCGDDEGGMGWVEESGVCVWCGGRGEWWLAFGEEELGDDDEVVIEADGERKR
jgi:hypothetical protein